MFCSQNSGEDYSIRFASLVLHFYHVLVCCSLKFLPPKEIKETEIEGYGSLKGERWGKKIDGCPQKTIEDIFVMQL